MSIVNFYQELDVDPAADADEIATAIRQKRRRYRQLAGAPSLEQRSLAEKKIELLAEAEKVLGHPESRANYDQRLRQSPGPPPEQGPVASSSDWVGTAESYLANGQTRNAAVAAREATRVQPDSIDAWKIRAYAALELEDFQDAEFAASEANRRAPSDPALAGILGDVYDGEKRPRDAQRAFARAAQLEPDNPYWQGRVVWAISDQGDILQAVSGGRDLVERFPDEEYAKLTYACMLLRDAEAGVSKHNDSLCITNEKQIQHVQDRLDRVRQLGSSDQNVINYYRETADFLATAKKRRFQRPGCGFVIAAVLYVVLGLPLELWILDAIFPDWMALLALGAVNVLVMAFVVSKIFPYQWAINRRVIGASARTGLQ